MNGNDFAAVAREFMAADICIIWPQSHEVIEGHDSFAALNSAYPAKGRWRFFLIDLVAEANRVVSTTEITDGAQSARAITFHWVQGAHIIRQIEYWPDPYPAPDWRRRWVRPMRGGEDRVTGL